MRHWLSLLPTLVVPSHQSVMLTTIMLWNAGMITAGGVISEIFIPSLISMIIPAFVLQFLLKGKLGGDMLETDHSGDTELLEFKAH